MRGGDPERLIATPGCVDGSGVGRVWWVVVVVVACVGRGPTVYWRVQESLLYNSKGVKALWDIIADDVFNGVTRGVPPWSPGLSCTRTSTHTVLFLKSC